MRYLYLILFLTSLSARAQFWQEDFSQPGPTPDGLPPGWTSTDDSDNAIPVVFLRCSSPQNCPPFTQDFPLQTSFAAPSAAAGYLFANADAAGIQPKPFNTNLRTAPIDLPGSDRLFLQFYAFLSTNDFAADTSAWVDVRTDNGPWQSYFPFCELSEGDNFNQSSDNPREVILDLSDLIGSGSQELEIRWHWRGRHEWTFALDDVALFTEHPRNERVVWGAEPGQGDFAAGLNDWTTTGTAQTWQFAPEADLSDALTAGSTRHARTPTRCNGAAVFNADFYTTGGTMPVDPPFPVYVSELISPIIDLSDTDGKLALRFAQSARLFDAAPGFPSPTSFSFSTDGGATWSPRTNANPDLEQQEARDRVSTFSLPAAATGATEFRLRFTFAGNLFWWLIDDVAIVTRPDHDLAVVRNGVVLPPSVQIPFSQSPELSFAVDLENRGGSEETGVIAGVEILGTGSAPLFMDTTFFGNLVCDELVEGVPFDETYSLPATSGTYRLRYYVTADSTDEVMENNTVQRDFFVTDTTFAKETGATRAISPNLPGGAVSYAYGNCFYVANGTAFKPGSISFALRNAEEMSGQTLALRTLEWRGDLNGDLFANPDEYEQIAVNEYFILGDEDDQLITVSANFEEDTVRLKDDRYYIVLVEYQSGTGPQFFMAASEQYDYNATFFHYLDLGAPRYAAMLQTDFSGNNISVAGFGLDVVPVVRFHLRDQAVGTNDPMSAAGPWQIGPNPAVDRVRVWQPDFVGKVEWMLINPEGKSIRTGVFRGNETEFSLSALPTGLYTIRLRHGGNIFALPLVVAH